MGGPAFDAQWGSEAPVAFEKQIEYLRRANAQPGVQAYKQRTFECLRVQKGDKLLDVGCGVGDDARALAELVGEAGAVTGIDNKRCMIEEAQAQTLAWCAEKPERARLKLGFLEADVCKLDEFQRGAFRARFDACRADRVLQHLPQPAAALKQMAGALRPGGRVVVSEPDWETAVVHSGNDRALTRKVLNYWADTRAQGWMGRQLPALFKECGLINIQVEPISISGVMRAYDWELDLLALVRSAEQARSAGCLTADEFDAWLYNLKEAERTGTFLAQVGGFLVSGQKRLIRR